jgi:hypothetical protein
MRIAISVSLFWLSFLLVTAAMLGTHLMPPWVGTVMDLPGILGG